MKKLTSPFVLIFCCFSLPFACAQSELSDFAGTYSDAYTGTAFTTLTLHENGTFHLKTYDPVFPYSFLKFENKGEWAARDNDLVLNPNLEPYHPKISLSEKTTTEDSIRIKINYFLVEYQNDVLKDRDSFDFNQMTIYINKKKNYFNLVQKEKIRICGFAPKIKNQFVIDNNDSIVLPNQEISRIGIQTYGFDGIMWFEPKQKEVNYYEFGIIHPIDVERRPRSKKMFAKGKKLFYYEKNGEVNRSLLAGRLWKIK